MRIAHVRRAPLLHVTSAIVVAGMSVVAAAEPAILDLPGGGHLPGAMAATGGGDAMLSWRSPLCAAPLAFHLDEIAGVRFIAPRREPAAATFRCVLRGGDLLDGEITGIDGEHVSLKPRGGERSVRVRRAAIERISRIGSRIAGSYVGPGGLTGWRHEPDGAWRSEAGHIAASRPGTALIDVAAPRRAIYDVVVSWRRRPELVLSMAASETSADDAFWVELLRLHDGTFDAAVVRREKDRAAIEPLAAGDAATKSLRLVMFVDQEKGRLAVFAIDRGGPGPVAEVTVPPPPRDASGRFRISLGEGDVALDSLRVTPWTTEEPAIESQRAARVVAGDGRTVEGEVVSIDSASGALLVRGASGESRLPMAAAEEIIFGGGDVPADPAEPAPTIRVMQASGGTLAGLLAGVDDADLRLRVSGIDDPIVIPLGDVASIASLLSRASPRELPGRVGTLIAGEASLAGCLVDGHEVDAPLAWWPRGAAAPAPLTASSVGSDAVVEYVPRGDREVSRAAEVEIGGIGGMVSQDGQGFFVVTMLSEDGAAAQDGRLQPGDRLLAIKPRPEGGFVQTQGHDVQTVMNLMRGRVGSPVVLRVAAPGGPPRDIDLSRGLIYVAGREILDQALATHERLAAAAVVRPEDAASYPSLAILRSGDLVPCRVEGMDATSIRLRTPIADGGSPDPIVVPEALVQAVELDPMVPARGIDKSRFDRLLMLPRSQRVSPPTQMVRLHDGDYLRGRLVSLDDASLVLDVRGEAKKLPRNTVARIIWLHPETQAGASDAEGEPKDPPQAGLLVQGVGQGRRVTLVAEGLADGSICGLSPAIGPGRIAIAAIDRLLIGRAIDGEADQLPFRQWKLRSAPEPKAVRDAAGK